MKINSGMKCNSIANGSQGEHTPVDESCVNPSKPKRKNTQKKSAKRKFLEIFLLKVLKLINRLK